MMAADARFERRHIVSAADIIRYLAAERPSAAFLCRNKIRAQKSAQAFKKPGAAHTYIMVKIRYAAFCAVAALCALLCACNISADSSLKELTHPCVTRYECTYARWGETDFLEEFDYIRITLLDTEKMALEYKKTGESAHSYECSYTLDEKTGEFTAEAGALGIKFREKIKIEDGKFTVSLPLMGRQLIMKFQS